MLLVPFSRLLRGALGPIPWFKMTWRPAGASLVMLGMMFLLWNVHPLLALAAGTAVYSAVLLLLRPLDATEIERLMPLLPGRLRRL